MAPSRTEAFTAAVDWIRENGGNVTSISYDSARSGICASGNLTGDSVVLSIPLRCCITAAVARSSVVGKAAAAAAARATRTFLSVADVILAFHVASAARRPDGCFHAPYFALLPMRGGTDEEDDPRIMLPRNWTDKELAALLGGSSSTLAAAKTARLAIRADYDQVSACCKEPLPAGWPNFDEFDWACAIVSSRCFELEAPDGSTVEALIPLADMLNHTRQRQTSYSLLASTADASSLLFEMRTRGPLSANAPIHDTYGAKGSAQLLQTFGFAMIANFEPDGSSNDVCPLELPKREDLSPSLVYSPPEAAPLRIGPKSYSFAPLTNALDAFRAAAVAAKPSQPAGKASAKLAAKLELEMQSLKALSAAIANARDAYGLSNKVALAALKGRPPPPPERQGTTDVTRRRWARRAAAAAALVLCEQQTLAFFGRAVAHCLAVLAVNDDDVTAATTKRYERASRLRAEVASAKTSESPKPCQTSDDVDSELAMLHWHSADARAAPLALAYLQIRVPEVLVDPEAARRKKANAVAGTKSSKKLKRKHEEQVS